MIVQTNTSPRDQIHDPNNSNYRGWAPFFFGRWPAQPRSWCISLHSGITAQVGLRRCLTATSRGRWGRGSIMQSYSYNGCGSLLMGSMIDRLMGSMMIEPGESDWAG